MKKISSFTLAIMLVLTFTISAYAGVLSIQCNASGYTLDLRGGAGSKSVEMFTYVYDDSTPVVGVLATFTLTYPDGTVVQKTGRTDTLGRAKATFRLDQSGDYTLNKSVTVGAQTAACTETFTVLL